ncbi:hypothetical protein [Prosthecobacter sp.]|uniref:hypothetical protein n=1 Tax=Prosthecobacter sp. TaxID=1965333 RepID=UPI0024898CBF|nr:hypothetical protein [Prosthecobacter sp.]MDI1311789.1 hypothetical protein [Prosthecobacter sp.]
MVKSTPPSHETQGVKKNDRRSLAVILGLMLVTLPGLVSCLKFFHETTVSPTAAAITHLKIGITAFEVDSAHFPIPEPDWHGPDVSLRTRGPILPALLGQDPTLNPKDIKFIDFPAAPNRKDGLWQDGTEWVLSDLWGESYYIILDTNGDGKITNPEFRPDPPAPKDAQQAPKHPLPETLPQKVLIYSSGPDRDPKTWTDNIRSWHPESEPH